MGQDPAPQVKKVVLPSGKTIEVVLFPEHEADDPLHAPAESGLDIHVCVSCSCPLVFPAEWEEAGPENWSVTLCCPNCGHERHGVFSQESVEFFDELLDEGANTLARDYRRLVRANLSEEVERFSAALEADALLPEDF
jgi:hypothetical protein